MEFWKVYWDKTILEETFTLLRALERANLNHWTWIRFVIDRHCEPDDISHKGKERNITITECETTEAIILDIHGTSFHSLRTFVIL
jgi:hypothetical protein